MARVLLTGSEGFVGRHLAALLRDTRPDFEVVRLDIAPEAELHHDLRDPLQAREAVREVGPDLVFHLAGTLRSADWRQLFEGNAAATMNLLEALVDSRPECHVTVPGSAAEYGALPPEFSPLSEDIGVHPATPYGVAKAAQTMAALYFAARGLSVTVGRVFNLAGPATPPTLALGAFAGQLREIRAGHAEPRLLVGDLDPVRDFIDVRDAAKALLALAESGRPGGLYNVCSGRGVRVGDALARMIEISGLDVAVEVDPDLARVGETSVSIGSNARITEETGWMPSVSFDEMLLATLG